MIVGKQYFQTKGHKFVLLTILEIEEDRAKYRIDACYLPDEIGVVDWFYPEPNDELKEATDLIRALL
jgi:hypothetical protein